MILNLSQIKTEALLLFCKDLIESYKNSDDIEFDIDTQIKTFIDQTSEDFLKQLTIVSLPNDYYIKNKDHFRIKAVLKAYNYINKQIDKELKKIKVFNPSMLYFSLLAVWFKELNKESKSKKYIYFTLFPYGDVYDKLLVNIKDEKFKSMNIAMIELAEKVVLKLDKISFK